MQVKSDTQCLRLSAHAKEGHPTPPRDGRHDPIIRGSRENALSSDNFFELAYEVFAEWPPDPPEDQHANADRAVPALAAENAEDPDRI